LKLEYDGLCSKFTFNFNLRRYCREACRNHANNMVYYIDHTSKSTTYIRPAGGPASSLQPFAGMPAGGFTAGAPAPGSAAMV